MTNGKQVRTGQGIVGIFELHPLQLSTEIDLQVNETKEALRSRAQNTSGRYSFCESLGVGGFGI